MSEAEFRSKRAIAARPVALPPACPHRPPCPGCPRYGERGLARGAREALEALAREHGVAHVDYPPGGPRAGFRLRARLAIRGRLGAPKLGLFELGTHKLVHVPHCAVHHPLVNRVAEVVRGALVDARVPAYSDTAHLGVARYLQVVVERGTQRAQVVLVANSPTPEPVAPALDLIRERLGEELQSLWCNSNVEPRNTILGPTFVNWCGEEAVVERFGGAAVYYPPGAFGQSNLHVAERIVAHVRERVPAGARVAEFYAGVGAIGLSLLDRVASIAVNEVSPQSLHGLELGLARLDADARARVRVVPGAAGECASATTGADLVIADPPRKGLDPALREQLATAPPERFVYVSCGLESLLADAARLTAGGLRLRELAAFDLMPYTEHVETVATFERA